MVQVLKLLILLLVKDTLQNKGLKMNQQIQLNQSQTKQFNSIMAMLKFVDEMVKQGYTKDQAIKMVEKVMGAK